MSVSVPLCWPMNAISLPSGDQTGSRSLFGDRETLNGGRDPSSGIMWTSRLKSLSSTDTTIHFPSGDQSYSIALNDSCNFLAFLPSASMIHSSPRLLLKATLDPSGLKVRFCFGRPSVVTFESLNLVCWNQYFVF